jgi:histidyl-tRNA synthetase
MAPKLQARLPKGMRDFLPVQMRRREYVFGIVREMFARYGFEPMQTPVLELRETLMGKYGEEAEKLIYRAEHPGGKEEVAMRYDLTVPLARFVAMYPNDIVLPFRRYQLSPVWRGERPQRGRYREFYQCDADIVGAPGMAADAEVVSLVVAVLERLGFPQFTVKINNRKLLTAIGTWAGVEGPALAELYRSIDKFDKVGAVGVRAELVERGLPAEVVDRVMGLITISLDDSAKLDFLETTLKTGAADDTALLEGVNELRALLAHLEAGGVNRARYAIDFTMVRGLGYYTGPIFETVITEPNLGSVQGGGRYDDLIGLFRGERVPTTGISFGIERIIDVMEELGLFPEDLGATATEVFVTVFDETTRAHAARLAADLRAAGLATDLSLLDKPLGKQLGMADKKGVPVAALLGSDEIAAGVVRLKRLRDAHEVTVPRAEAAAAVRALLHG